MLDAIRERRREIYDNYCELLKPLIDAGRIRAPIIPPWVGSNYHMFYSLFPSVEIRDAALEQFRQQQIQAVFHYVPLHSAPFFRGLVSDIPELPVTDDLSGRLLRLPMFYELTDGQQRRVVSALAECLAAFPAIERGFRSDPLRTSPQLCEDFFKPEIVGRAKLPLSREIGTRIDSTARREPRPPEGT